MWTTRSHRETSIWSVSMDGMKMAAGPLEAGRATSLEGQVRLVTIPAAAQLLGVSRSKLYELLAEGALPTVRIGRSRRIAMVDLEAFVRRCREPA